MYLWGRSIQEMGGNVVIGHSIHGVVVIDGSLHSRFYGKQFRMPSPGWLNITVESTICHARMIILARVLSSIVSRTMKLVIRKLLFWLTPWEWTRAWKYWGNWFMIYKVACLCSSNNWESLSQWSVNPLSRTSSKAAGWVYSQSVIFHCSLYRNSMTESGAIALASALQQNKSLEGLK